MLSVASRLLDGEPIGLLRSVQEGHLSLFGARGFVTARYYRYRWSILQPNGRVGIGGIDPSLEELVLCVVSDVFTGVEEEAELDDLITVWARPDALATRAIDVCYVFAGGGGRCPASVAATAQIIVAASIPCGWTAAAGASGKTLCPDGRALVSMAGRSTGYHIHSPVDSAR